MKNTINKLKKWVSRNLLKPDAATQRAYVDAGKEIIRNRIKGIMLEYLGNNHKRTQNCPCPVCMIKAICLEVKFKGIEGINIQYVRQDALNSLTLEIKGYYNILFDINYTYKIELPVVTPNILSSTVTADLFQLSPEQCN